MLQQDHFDNVDLSNLITIQYLLLPYQFLYD